MPIDSNRLRNTLKAALVAHLAAQANRDIPPEELDAEELQTVIDSVDDTCEIHAYLSGGIVQDAACEHPLSHLVALEVVDFDIEGSDPSAIAVPVDGSKPEGVWAYGPVISSKLVYALKNTGA
jgi:hypothetical protein